MHSAEPAVPPGECRVWSGAWLRYQPSPGVQRYQRGYRGVLLGWWNGAPEFVVDAATAAAIARDIADLAAYADPSWDTVRLDGPTLHVTRPGSLGGGTHRVPVQDGRHRVGWGPPWLLVPAFRCDHIPGPDVSPSPCRRSIPTCGQTTCPPAADEACMSARRSPPTPFRAPWWPGRRKARHP